MPEIMKHHVFDLYPVFRQPESRHSGWSPPAKGGPHLHVRLPLTRASFNNVEAFQRDKSDSTSEKFSAGELLI
jgi:hypothetical protein